MANPQLRELLDRGSRRLDLPFDNAEPIDITERFFEDCSKLALGEVVRYDSFTLGEAMSAVELMDEKMDIGMKKVTRQMGLDESKSMGLYQSNYAEQLTVYDATLCSFVTWLEGSCIGQTLWTNVLLTEPDRVLFKEHPVFSCLAHGFFHAVMLVKCVIQNASVYEEEDFNPHLPFPCSSQYSLHEVLQFMKEVELDLVSKAEKPDHASLKAVLLSLSSRIAFLRLFLVTITHLVPPRRTECVDSDPLQMPPLDAIGFTYVLAIYYLDMKSFNLCISTSTSLYVQSGSLESASGVITAFFRNYGADQLMSWFDLIFILVSVTSTMDVA